MNEKDLTMKTLFCSRFSIMITRSSDDVVLGVNPFFCLKSCYDESTLIGKKLPDLCIWSSPEDGNRFLECNERGGYLEPFEIILIHGDNERTPYVLSAERYDHFEESWTLISGYENSERKGIENALKHSESLYREAQEMAHIGHWELDLKSHKLIWSEEIFRIFDMEPSVFGASYDAFLDLIHPEDREKVDQAYKLSIENDTPYNVIHRLKMKDGKIKYVHERGRTEKDRNNEPVRSIGTVQDITALKESELARERMENQIRQSRKLESIGTLAGGIAHDFNNILFAILGFTEISFDITEEGSPLRKNLERIYQAGNRAKELVSQILTFCRQNIELKKPLMIRAIVKEAMKLIKSTLPASISIIEHLESSSKIFADSTQIHQVVMNLCSNSAHAMQSMDTGLLTVELMDMDVDTEFAARYLHMAIGKYVLLLVSDTGHGMEPEVKERIFDPFFTTKSEDKGTGLGLSVVHGIVKTHEGEITVYSEPGVGTTVKIYFPVIEICQDDEKKCSEPMKRGDERILLVDDEKVLADLIYTMLTSLGYRVTAETDPISAFETFNESPEDFDLLITDMNMPKMNGLRLAENILAIKKTMKVIIGTGFSEKISEEQVRHSGISTMIYKPIMKRDLSHIVRKVLDGVV